MESDPRSTLLLSSNKILYSDSILLRQQVPADCENMLELSVYDGKFARNTADSQEIGERIENDHQAGNCIHWVICDIQNTQILGTIGFYRGFRDSVGEIGYIIKKEFRRNGFCTAAIKSACEFGFVSLGLVKIRAYTGFDNPGSRRALEKNGFRMERKDESRITYFRDNDILSG